MATVDEVRVQLLTQRIANAEKRHTEEITNLEITYMIRIDELQREIDELKPKEEEPEEAPPSPSPKKRTAKSADNSEEK